MRIRNLILVRTRASEARSTLEIWLGTGSTLKISVTTYWGEVGRARSKVMRRQVSGKIVMIVVARREGTMGARATIPTKLLSDVVLTMRLCGGLPVDGLHAVLEGARGPELPLANDSPDDACSTDGSTDGNKDDDRVTLQLGDAARRSRGGRGRGRRRGAGDSDLRQRIGFVLSISTGRVGWGYRGGCWDR